MRSSSCVLLLCVLARSATAVAADDGRIILDTSSFWRYHYTIKLPLIRKGGKLEKMTTDFGQFKAVWLEHDTSPPPKGWQAPRFDDSSWPRLAGVLMTGGKARTKKIDSDSKSPFMGLVCMRGRFDVKAPAKGMKLVLEYRGGAAVYVNGGEVARKHLAPGAGGDDLADDYGEGEDVKRRLEVDLPVASLKKGVNVLAVEIRRSAYPEKHVKVNATKWPRTAYVQPATCGVESIRLTAPRGAVANVTRPAGFQVWNSDPLTPDFDMDYGDPNEPLRPVRIVAARNGTFSGKVVVGSREAIKGLKATMGDLKGPRSRIAASKVTIRYGMPGGTENGANRRYLHYARRFDPLETVAPIEIPVVKSRPGRLNMKSSGVDVVPGAVVPVWLTVDVPRSATAGVYTGRLTISAAGQKAAEVPVSVEVVGWTVPSPEDGITFAEIYQSPETLAMEYGVELWSDRHFELIEETFAILGRAGNDTVHIPLIRHTNMGNDQSMVRWKDTGDGYAYDFGPLERYLDIVVKCQGKPKVVAFHLWESFLTHTGRMDKWEPGGTKAAQKEWSGKGVEVTTIDGDGRLGGMLLPVYEDPKSRALISPFAAELIKLMKRKKLDDVMALGIMSDWHPTKEATDTLAAAFPGVPWINVAHNWSRDCHGQPLIYRCNVYQTSTVVDPSVRRPRGWANKKLEAHFPRMTRDDFPLSQFRYMGEMNIARNYRGFARLGGDFWPVLKNKRGKRVGSLSARWPKSAWHNLNIEVFLLAPGKEGPLSTHRFEMLCEGLQECEARIFIERALSDKALKAKLGPELAQRGQDVLDERTRAMRRAVSTLIQSGSYSQHACRGGNWWQNPAAVGSNWHLSSGWQDRSKRLFETAAEVAAKTGMK